MISVCMATYNGAKYIKEQVDSILAQLSYDDELIVSDDGSTDNTLDILRSYNDKRIIIYSNDNRKSIVGNFENAIKHSQGEYIFLSDQDDVWLEGKVEKCVAALQHADLVLHDAIVWNGVEIINESFFRLRNAKKGYINNLIKNSYIGCCIAFKKNLKSKILPFPNVAMHDIYIGLIAERYFKTTFIYESLLLYRRHGANASQTSEKSTYSLYFKLKYRLKMLLYTVFK